MNAQESERRMLDSSKIVPSAAALKDSPAVERALGRSKLYLLVSWCMLYPEDDEFLDYLQSGEFVEDGRSAIQSLTQSLDLIGGEHTKKRLIALSKALDQIEGWVASECANWQLTDLQAEHRRVFSNVITLDCPPYETLFGNDHVFGQSHVMGDIAGFYKAFGVELSRDIHERIDHLSVELEFMHFLAYKESYARCHDGAEKTQIVVDAQKKFVKEHIGRWVPLFARMLVKKADTGFFRYIAEFTSDWMDFDAAYLGVTPKPYSEADYRPATFSAPEGQTYECGAQDQGNELSMLLDEVGAQSFMEQKEKDKDKDEPGPVGTA
ncbi:MAG: TorD/DmsD family molecular chaperone [Nitrospiraceae bacterium]